MSVRLLSDDEAAAVSTDDIIAAVREALIAVADDGRTDQRVLSANGGDQGEAVNLKFGRDAQAGLVGFKCGTLWPGNAAQGLPNHAAFTVLLDRSTGRPSALLNATLLNRRRTAAADVLAVEALAPPAADTLLIVGAGPQAEAEARLILTRRPFQTVRIFAREATKAAALAARLGGVAAAAATEDLPGAAASSDVIVIATTATAPVLRSQWITPGTHISAMGADRPGKQELDTELVARSEVFADLPSQAVAIGEFRAAHAAGRLELSRITPLGLVLAGRHPGRPSPEAVTIFDSSGLSLQDLHVAAAALKAAEARGAGLLIEI